MSAPLPKAFPTAEDRAARAKLAAALAETIIKYVEQVNGEEGLCSRAVIIDAAFDACENEIAAIRQARELDLCRSALHAANAMILERCRDARVTEREHEWIRALHIELLKGAQ